MTDLTGKVAVVTGASRGIGAAIARELAAAGAAVIVNYGNDKVAADRVVDAIMSKGGRAIAVKGDVAKAADVRRLFAEAKATFGPVSILVNNAAAAGFSPIEAVTEDDYRRMFDTNVLGSILTIREALAHFGSVGGSIINIGSLSSINATPGSVVYAATKGAIATITSVMAAELGSRNIRVNTIAPGPIDTEGTRAAGLIGSPLETQLVAMTPLGRLGQPRDIARVAVFLASEEAGWLTGAWIPVTGGLR
jgi:3-oxoacyl-[acyl-carrier protein] reductase